MKNYSINNKALITLLSFCATIVFSSTVYADLKKSKWAEKRVNTHLKSTGENIYRQKMKAEVEAKMLNEYSPLGENQSKKSDPAQSFGVIENDVNSYANDFAGEEYYDQNSPVADMESEVSNQREIVIQDKEVKKRYIKQFMKNAQEEGHRVKLDKNLQVHY